MRSPMSRLTALALVAVSAGVAGTAVRTVIPPPGPVPYDVLARSAVARDATAAGIGWAALALAGLAAAAASGWPVRIAGGLTIVAAGLLSAAPLAVWWGGTAGAALLLAAAFLDRSIRRAAGEPPS